MKSAVGWALVGLGVVGGIWTAGAVGVVVLVGKATRTAARGEPGRQLTAVPTSPGALR